MTTERKIACLQGSEFLINLLIVGPLFFLERPSKLLGWLLVAAIIAVACNVTAHTIARRRIKASSGANFFG